MLTKIEQKVFFPVVRFIVFVAAAALLITMVVCLIYALNYRFDSKKELNKMLISFNTVFSSLNPNKAASDLAYPGNVLEFFSSDRDKRLLQNWLAELKSDKEKQDFIMNLSEIIYEAERKDRENIREYVNEYKRLTIGEDEDSFIRGIKQYLEPIVKKVEPTVEATVKWAIVFGVGCLFLLFIVVTLLLLQFSIERNTR
jgi:hypothetical protein